MLGRASGRTWKLFTFVEGPVSVKDDRASASENQVCMGFFFFPANSQTLKRSDTVQGRNHALLQAGMWLWANQVPGAKLSLWRLMPSNLGFCELGKDNTCLRHLFSSSNRILQVPSWPSTPGTFHLPLWEFSIVPAGNRCCRACLVPIHA